MNPLVVKSKNQSHQLKLFNSEVVNICDTVICMKHDSNCIIKPEYIELLTCFTEV
jgi:hypothetical protein